MATKRRRLEYLGTVLYQSAAGSGRLRACGCWVGRGFGRRVVVRVCRSGLDGCELRLCDPCARVCPVCVPCASRLPPVSFYRYCFRNYFPGIVCLETLRYRTSLQVFVAIHPRSRHAPQTRATRHSSGRPYVQKAAWPPPGKTTLASSSLTTSRYTSRHHATRSFPWDIQATDFARPSRP